MLEAGKLAVNLRASKGLPVGSYTVHTKLCVGAAPTYDPQSEVWATSTEAKVNQLAGVIFFGACGHCYKPKDKQDQVWATSAPKVQMLPADAKALLESP